MTPHKTSLKVLRICSHGKNNWGSCYPKLHIQDFFFAYRNVCVCVRIFLGVTILISKYCILRFIIINLTTSKLVDSAVVYIKYRKNNNIINNSQTSAQHVWRKRVVVMVRITGGYWRVQYPLIKTHSGCGDDPKMRSQKQGASSNGAAFLQAVLGMFKQHNVL